MVCFTCQNCNECLKKNAVVKHGYMSRRCQPLWLTCIDCLKDFRGDEHVQHTSCVTEDVRYGGKGAKVKPQGVKQNGWIGCVEKVVNTPHSNSKINYMLHCFRGQTNVPRIRNKFHNFIKSKLSRGYEERLADEIFSMFQKEFEMSKATKIVNDNRNVSGEKCGGTNSLSEELVSGHTEMKGKENFSSRENGKEANEKKTMKRKNLSKEEEIHQVDNQSHEQAVNHKKRKLEDNAEDSECLTTHGQSDGIEKMDKKERKKRKKELKYLAELKEIENYNKNDDEQEENEKPLKKSKRQLAQNEEDVQETLCKPSTEEPTPETPAATSFNWDTTILEVLRNRKSISLKKLKKLVLNEYVLQFGEPHDLIKLSKKFDKKLKRFDNVVINGDKAMLEEKKA